MRRPGGFLEPRIRPDQSGHILPGVDRPDVQEVGIPSGELVPDPLAFFGTLWSKTWVGAIVAHHDLPRIHSTVDHIQSCRFTDRDDAIGPLHEPGHVGAVIPAGHAADLVGKMLVGQVVDGEQGRYPGAQAEEPVRRKEHIGPETP